MASKETDVVKYTVLPPADAYKHPYQGYFLKKSKKAKGTKRVKIENTNLKEHWVNTHRAMLRWQKTPEFDKWRRKQFLKQGGTCYYCDELLIGVKQNIEHIVPKSKGGDNRKSNLVIACWKCNKEKYTDLLSYKTKEKLRQKNKKKKGTFQKNFGHIQSDEQAGYNLGQMFRE